MTKICASLVLLLATLLAQSTDSITHLNVAGRDVAVWKPQVSALSNKGYPLILFSHGFGGCNTQSIFLMEALAHSGYLVLAPNHKDASCGTAKQNEAWYPGKLAGKKNRAHPEEPFRDEVQWTDK